MNGKFDLGDSFRSGILSEFDEEHGMMKIGGGGGTVVWEMLERKGTVTSSFTLPN